jgi:hypothetical protein
MDPSRPTPPPAPAPTPGAELDDRTRSMLDDALATLMPRYDPLPRRLRRLAVPALALATALGVFYLMLERPGATLTLPPSLLAPAAVPEQRRCEPGQTRDCVGGRAEVLLVAPPSPSQAPASAPAPAR